MTTGRFAPSPTGDLHLGNLRTALVAALGADRFVVRVEDLDRVTSSAAIERRQLADLAALGIESDVPVVRQSERFALHRDAISTLRDRGLVYPCYCTRREIREAARAPHGEVTAYPGTCRELSTSDRRLRESDGRRPALRLRTGSERYTVDDLVAGTYTGPVDDVVLQRNDGVPAYNLAVVVDDAAQGIDQVVRGDDLLASTPRQMHLQRLLGLPAPAYAHLPLVVGADGVRLAKRHGSVTLPMLRAAGIGAGDVLTYLAGTIGLVRAAGETVRDMAGRFSFDLVPRERLVLRAGDLCHDAPRGCD